MSNIDSTSNKQTLDQNYNILLNQRKQIEKLEKEYVTLDSANKDAQLVVTEYYSKYIVLVFITLLLVLLLVKFASTGEGQVGGGNNFMNESIFLLILMTVSIGLAPVINNLNAYIITTMVVISYVIIKMKVIATKY
jgi:hypothetical protein